MKRVLLWTLGVGAVLLVAAVGVHMKDPIVETFLIWRLDSRDEGVRMEAVRELNALRSLRAVEHLMQRLVTTDTVDSRRALYPLFAELDTEFRSQAFAQALLDPDRRKAELAENALTHLIVDTIMEGPIAYALLERGIEAERFLVSYLTWRSEPEARQWAAEVFVNLRPQTVQAIEALTHALRDTSPKVRRFSAMAFGFLGDRARPAIPQLLALLQDSDTRVRDQVLWALCKLGATGDDATVSALSSNELKVFLEAIPDSVEGETRSNAAILLRRLQELEAQRGGDLAP